MLRKLDALSVVMVVAVTTTLIMTMALSMTVSNTMISFLWQQGELIDDPFFVASIVLEMLVLGAPLWQSVKRQWPQALL